MFKKVLAISIATGFSFGAAALHLPPGKNNGRVINQDVAQYAVKFVIGGPYKIDGKNAGAYMGLCSGTFISDRVLLTAGHCIPSVESGDDQTLGLFQFDGDRFKDLVGFKGRQFQAIAHPAYATLDEMAELEFGSYIDIGVIKFSQPVYHGPVAKLFETAKGEKLSRASFTQGAQFFAIGGGTRNYPWYFPARELQNQLYAFSEPMKGSVTTLISADGRLDIKMPRGVKVCVGDSGGPVLTTSGNKISVAGVLSQGYAQRNLIGKQIPCGQQVFAASVSGENGDWIRSHLEK
jgi:hypothetical protein